MYVPNGKLDEKDFGGEDLWMNRATTMKSIRTNPTNKSYMNLVDNQYMPAAMAESILNLVQTRCSLDDTHFIGSLQ